MIEKIYDYLFGEYIEGEDLYQIKDDLAVFVKMLCEMMDMDKFNIYQKDVTVVFLQIISQPLFRYTTAELFFDFLMSLQYELRNTIIDIDQQLRLMDLFSSFYRELAITNWQVIHGQQEGMERMSRLINSMTVDMLRMEDEGRIPYERALDNLNSIGMQTAYLFTFEEPVYHPRETRFIKPDKLLFRAYYDKKGAVAIPEQLQLMDTDDIFNHDKLPKDRRVTMVLSPLFSDEE